MERTSETRSEGVWTVLAGSPLKVLSITRLDKVIPSFACVADLHGA